MSNIQNGRMSAAAITFNGQSLGHTTGGVTFHYEPQTDPIKFDQFGDTPVDMILHGESFQIVVNLAEPVVDILQAAIPGGTQITNSGNKRLNIGKDAGFSLRTVAAQLVLHPLDKTLNDLTEDVVLYKCVVADTVELNYEVDNQRVFEVTFTALVDETYGNGRRLGHVGVTNVS